MATSILTPEQARQTLLLGKASLIDVRTPAEYAQVHAEGAVNLPLDSISMQSLKTLCPSEHAILLICKSGTRANQAGKLLENQGGTQLFLIDGGTDAWVGAGLPCVRGQKAISLERQVRIAAGSLVVLGILLSFLWPAFRFLSFFVGCGLIFAGITDTCGMALILGRMPWNRREAGRNAQSCTFTA